MRIASVGVAALLLACHGYALGRASADAELEQYEDRAIARCTERAVRLVKSDRVLWVKVLEAAYPDRVVNATTEEEYATWFVLLAGKAEEWRKESVVNAQVGELYEKVIQRLELGPVPSIKKDEFARYARRILIPGNPPAAANNNGTPAPDPSVEEADKVFRALDRNGDGNLEREELTLRLKDDRIRSDADGNGRIDKDEYRAYFTRRVTVSVETSTAKSGEGGLRGPDGKPTGKAAPGAAMPAWFTTLDEDKDNQIALSEWRRSGRSITTFNEMDLDEDGLLTKDEYLRFVRKNEKTTEVKTPPKGNPLKK